MEMKKAQQIVVVFLFLCLQSHGYDTFDYFKLVLQWPPSICNGQRPCEMVPLPRDFTIHGFWPDNFQGRFPTNCYVMPYFPITNPMLLDLLNTYWPNIVGANNPAFWKYQWDKHGTCALAWYTQNQYFYLAVVSRQDIDLLTHLTNNGFPPSDEVSYRMDAIRNLVRDLTQTIPDFSCNYDIGNNPQLSEIRICYNNYGQKVDCGRINTNCPDYVFFSELY